MIMQNVQIAGGVNTNRLIPMKGEKMSEEKAIKDLQKNLYCSPTSWDELGKMYYSAQQQIQQLEKDKQISVLMGEKNILQAENEKLKDALNELFRRDIERLKGVEREKRLLQQQLDETNKKIEEYKRSFCE